MSKIHISVARNPQNNYTLLHKPNVILNGAYKKCDCPTYELLESLKSAGIPDEEINRARREIEEKGWTDFESTKITDAGLESAVSKCCEQERNLTQPNRSAD